MKKFFSQTQAFTFLFFLILGTSCNAQSGKVLPKDQVGESKVMSAELPKLIKTQGSQKGDGVNSSLHHKRGNLWFGTTREGLYKYDGKAFTQFTVADGLLSNGISCIIEYKAGRLWIGTRNTGLYRYDGKSIIGFSE